MFLHNNSSFRSSTDAPNDILVRRVFLSGKNKNEKPRRKYLRRGLWDSVPLHGAVESAQEAVPKTIGSDQDEFE